MISSNRKLAVAARAGCLAIVVMLVGCTASDLISYSTDMPPVAMVPASYTDIVDGRGRFREVYCRVQKERGPQFPDDRPCEEAVVRLLDEPPPTGEPAIAPRPRAFSHIVFVPGIYSQCFIEQVRPLAEALDHLSVLGYQTRLIETSGTDSVSANARLVRDQIVAMNLRADDGLLLIGYSKGAAEVLEALTRFDELRGNTVAVLSIAGAVAGSPIADLLSTDAGKLLPRANVGACDIEGTVGIESITRRRRIKWLASHELPASTAYFSLVALPDPERVPSGLWVTYKLLAHVEPRNDGLIIFSDAVIPRGTLLGYVDTDHWNVVHRFPEDLRGATGEGFPQEVMLEASVRFIEEALDGD